VFSRTKIGHLFLTLRARILTASLMAHAEQFSARYEIKSKTNSNKSNTQPQTVLPATVTVESIRVVTSI
jgi:hypothetical protein